MGTAASAGRIIGRVALLCLALGGGLSGCNGAFHFGAPDAASAGGDDGGGAQPGRDAACVGACSAICASGSVCMITVGENGSVVCQDGAQCTIICGEGCTVMCATGAQCTVQCPGATTPVTITGTLRCPS